MLIAKTTVIGTLTYICLSEEKGTVKHPVPEAELVENFGLRFDAHAGNWHRQVSLLSEDDIDTMRSKGVDIEPGAFGENLIISGLDLYSLGIGSKLSIGEAVLGLTQIGKVCHNRCVIFNQTGDCIMPRAGLFMQVIKGGEIMPGMKVEPIEIIDRQVVQAAVLTVSDRCSSGERTDTAGPAVKKLVEERLSAHVSYSEITPDEKTRITARLKDLCGRGIDIVLTVGGTGCGVRDVTPEATRTVIQREVPGLAESMRSASTQITPHAMLQRGICGISGSTLVINLPGSEKAAVENLSIILPALAHAVKLLRGEDPHSDHVK